MSRSGHDEMSVWSRIDAFAGEALNIDDRDAAAALISSDTAGLPPIAVSAAQGRLLQLMARMTGARRILEVGTLGGYSTIWLARALAANGRLVTLERDPHHAVVAVRNLASAGLGDRVDVRTGPAAESLEALQIEGGDPFDFAFIDADKPSYPRYLALIVPLMRSGGVIVADNVVRAGRILAQDADANAQGARAFIEAAGREARLCATVVQTVGEKGHDGMLVAIVD